MYHFIINPNSRSGNGKKIWKTIKEKLDQDGVLYDFAMTQYVGHAKILSQTITTRHAGESPIRLVVLGGDGTIHEVLSGIVDLQNVVFGFIPAGSGNDFCRGMHLPQDPLEALDHILNCDKIVPVDVPCLADGDQHIRFGISTGIGYDAAVCQQISTSPVKKLFNRLHLGKLAYLFVALQQFFLLDLKSGSLTMDGDRVYHYDQVYFIAVMNQKYEGGGFKFCPSAHPGDRILDVIVVESIPKPLLLLYLPTAYWGGHTKKRGIHIYRCRSAEIHMDTAMPVHVDGESAGLRTDMQVALEKKKIRMIV